MRYLSLPVLRALPVCRAALTLAAVLPVLFATPAAAVFVNPNPAAYADDDQSQIFVPLGAAITFTGLTQLTGQSSTGLFGSGAPNTAVPLLTAADPAPTNVTVLFDVAPGINVVVGGSGVSPRPFSLPPGGISFFLSVPELSLFLSTEDLLNPAGLRLAATYPSRTVPGQYLLEFGFPGVQGGADIPLALVVVNNVAAVPLSVPEPATFAVLAAGLGLAAAARWRPAIHDWHARGGGDHQAP